MAGYWQRAKTYLGLGPEDDYADYGYVEFDEPEMDGDLARRGVSAPTRRARPPATTPRPTAARAGSSLDVDDADSAWEVAAVRVIDPPAGSTARAGGDETPRRSVVRAMPSVVTARPKVLSPSSFNDAQEIGDLFRSRQPVIVNFQGLDRDLARRLLDFASGVSYALSGSVERVSTHVYLLTPEDVEVSDDDRQKIREHGIGNAD